MKSISKHTFRAWCTLSMALKRLRLYTACRTRYSCGGTSDAFPLVKFKRLTIADRMIFFVIAFFTECFHWSGVVPLVPVSVSSLIVLVLVLWSLRTLRTSRQDIGRRMLAVLRSFASGGREFDSRRQIEIV